MVNAPWLAVVPLAAIVLAACNEDGGTTAASPPLAQAASSAPATTGTTLPTTSAASTPAPTSSSPNAVAPATLPAGIPETGPIELIVDVDDPAGQGQVQPIPLRRDVVLRLSSAVAREYHVHGFDVEADVEPGQEWVFEFTADQPGRFEVEDHTTDATLLVLEVA